MSVSRISLIYSHSSNSSNSSHLLSAKFEMMKECSVLPLHRDASPLRFEYANYKWNLSWDYDDVNYVKGEEAHVWVVVFPQNQYAVGKNPSHLFLGIKKANIKLLSPVERDPDGEQQPITLFCEDEFDRCGCSFSNVPISEKPIVIQIQVLEK